MKYRQNRHPTSFKVAVVHNDRKLNCTIINISETGARLHNVQGASVGDEVTISSSFGTAPGQVKWVKNDLCGIEFRPKISSQLVDLLQFKGGRPGSFVGSSSSPRLY